MRAKDNRGVAYQSIFRPDLFAGQVIIVTGGGSGIGRCTAHELASLGATVALVGRKPEKLASVAAEIAEDGGKASTHPCDIREEETVRATVAGILGAHGRIDGLVNNAGGQFQAPLADISQKGWETVVRTNLTGGFLMARECYTQWMRAHGGSIVNIVADMWNGMPGWATAAPRAPAWSTSPRRRRPSGAARGVRVNAVAPGWIASSGFDTYPADVQAMLRTLRNHTPLQRFGTEAEVSAAIVFLLSPAAGFISGDTLRVDGAAPNAKRHVDLAAARPLPPLERLPPRRAPRSCCGRSDAPDHSHIRNVIRGGGDPRHVAIGCRASRNAEAGVGARLRGHDELGREERPWNSPRSTRASAATSRSSSTRRSTRTSTNGRRPASSPPTSSSRRWATRAISASTSRPSTAAWGSTTPTRWSSSRALGHIRCGGVPMAIGVQTDMATPALARFGSEELCKEFLVPSIAGDYVACLGVSEAGAGSDVASVKTTATQGRRRLRHRRRQDVDHQRHAGRLDVPARQHLATGPAHKNKSLICLPMKTKGVQRRAQARQARHALLRHGADLLRGRARAAALPIGKEGEGFTYQMLQFQEERL